MKKTKKLMAGSGTVDITPPVGVSMVGALTPRPSTGIDDPLMVKALVLESGDTRVAVVVLDVAAIMKKTITVAARPFRTDEAARRRTSGWSKDLQKWFVASEKLLRRRGEKRLTSVIQAWRIGDVGFASIPGELFVEWGLKLKETSPFPWTYPVELGGDCLGYLVTESAEAAGGYESLNAITSRTDCKGSKRLVQAAGDCLAQLWERSGGGRVSAT